MYIRPNNSDPGKFFGVFLTIFLVLVALVIWASISISSKMDRPESSSPPTPSARTVAPAAPAVNPIERVLESAPAVPARQGVAAAILVDASGSMAETVRDRQGRPKAKIEIARSCLLDLVNQTDRFARQNPDRPVLVGIYEFSANSGVDSCRQVVPLAPPDPAAAGDAVRKMRPNGNTPIGDAMIRAKQDLDATGMSRMHILVITDGENNQGYALPDVVAALAHQKPERRASVYFIAFDVATSKFKAVRDAGGLVLPASNEAELQQTLDYVLTGKILAEQPEAPGKPN